MVRRAPQWAQLKQLHTFSTKRHTFSTHWMNYKCTKLYLPCVTPSWSCRRLLSSTCMSCCIFCNIRMLSIRLRVSHANDSLIWNVAPGKLTEEVLTTNGHDLHLLWEYSVVPGEVLHGWGGVCISLICLFDCSLVCRPPLGSYHRPSRYSDQNGRYRGNDEWFLKQPGYNVGMSCSVLFYRIWNQTWWEMPLYVR